MTKRNPKGVPGKVKLVLSIGDRRRRAPGSSPRARRRRCATSLALPFLKDVLVPLGIVGFLAFASW